MNNLSNFEHSNLRAYSDLKVFFNLGGKESLFTNLTKMLGRNNPPEKMETLIKVAKVVAFIALNIITVLMYVIYKALDPSVAAILPKLIENKFPDFIENGMKILHSGATVSINELRKLDAYAQRFLKEAINDSCDSIENSIKDPLELSKVTIGDLDSETFSVVNGLNIQDQMKKDAQKSEILAVYGVESKFNGIECGRPNKTHNHFGETKHGPYQTQDESAQMMYPEEKVQVIDKAMLALRNSIANVLDDTTKGTLKGGYLIPATQKDASAVIEQFKTNGHKLASTCIGSTLKEPSNSETDGKVYMVLSGAPALGDYLEFGEKKEGAELITEAQKAELSFQVTLREYRSLFEHGLRLAQQNKSKQVVIKPCALGLGAFGNSPVAVAKAYYQAAFEYSNQLKVANIRVELQIRPKNGNSASEKMAQLLKFSPSQ